MELGGGEQRPEPPGGHGPKGKGPGTTDGGRGLVQKLRQPQIAATIGIVLAALIIVVLVVSGGDDDGGAEPAAGGEAEAASVEDLQELADSSDFPVFWAGEKEGKQYELTVTGDGNIFIRYLDPDVEIGSQDVASLTVGTYPVQDAYGALRKIAKEPGSITERTSDGGLVVTSTSSPQSVYVAYPGTDYQIEVYDPDPRLALQTATSGEIQPIE